MWTEEDLAELERHEAEVNERFRKLEKERDEFRNRFLKLENALNWDTSCLNCSAVLDSSFKEYVRAEKAETALKEVIDAVEAFGDRMAVDAMNGALQKTGWLSGD